MYARVREEVRTGGRAYIIYPLVNASEHMTEVQVIHVVDSDTHPSRICMSTTAGWHLLCTTCCSSKERTLFL